MGGCLLPGPLVRNLAMAMAVKYTEPWAHSSTSGNLPTVTFSKSHEMSRECPGSVICTNQKQRPSEVPQRVTQWNIKPLKEGRICVHSISLVWSVRQKRRTMPQLHSVWMIGLAWSSGVKTLCFRGTKHRLYYFRGHRFNVWSEN